MRKALLVLATLLMATLALPVLAQETTATPEPLDVAAEATLVVEGTAEATAEAPRVQTAHIRVAHLAPDAPPVQIFVNGEVSDIQQLTFPDITGWVELPVGTYNIAVGPVDGTFEDAVIGPLDLSFAPNAWITIAAIGSVENGTLTAQLIPEDISAIPAGSARVTVFHAIEDGPAVDVVVDGDTIPIQGLGFTGDFTLDLPAGTYDIQVVATGTSDVILDLSGTEIVANTFNFIAAGGTAAEPVALVESLELNILSPFLDGATGTIVEVAQADGRFTTLLAALDAAGLTDTLNGEGEFTVFAPTDSAFALIPADTLNALLADEEALSDVLLYHVADGILTSDDVLAATTITTLQGGTIEVSQNADGVFLDGTAEIIILDIPATNGVIHAIAAVLSPTDGVSADATPELDVTAEATEGA